MFDVSQLLKPSALLRSGFHSWEEFWLIAQHYGHTTRGDVNAVTAANQKFSPKLLDVLTSEYDQSVRDVQVWQREVGDLWQVDLSEDIGLNSTLELEAFIMPNGSAPPRIQLSRGLCLSLEDAFQTVLSSRGFFTSRFNPDDVPDAFAHLKLGNITSGRFHDYGAMSAARAATLAKGLTHRIPLDAIRLAQVEMLHGFALRWIVLHEQSHYLLGHIDWLLAHRRGPTAVAVELSEICMFADSNGSAASLDSFCLELQADSLATQMLFSHCLAEEIVDDPLVLKYKRVVEACRDTRRA